MAESVNSISTSAASSQLTALAAVQAQVNSENLRASSNNPSADASAPAAPAASKAGSAPTNVTDSAQATAKPTAEDLHQATKKLQDYFESGQDITLQVDHDSGQNYVKVVDAKTKQLILQIPSKEVLAMARKLREAANPQAASGVLVDQQG
jgi:flagellar protein FlaG